MSTRYPRLQAALRVHEAGQACIFQNDGRCATQDPNPLTWCSGCLCGAAAQALIELQDEQGRVASLIAQAAIQLGVGQRHIDRERPPEPSRGMPSHQHGPLERCPNCSGD